MRLPSIVRPRVGRAQGFQPSQRIDVYDRYAERKTGKPVLVAKVYTDGEQGRVELLDQRFKDTLQPLFEGPLLSMGSGGTDQGISADGTPRRLAPWGAPAIDHILRFDLPGHQLRGELISLRSATGKP